MKYVPLLCLISITLISCKDGSSEPDKKEGHSDGAITLFTKVNKEESGINFRNKMEESLELNFLNYAYVYAGAGLAVGDIDKDGLEDIYFVSNMGPNKLYRNKGGLKFEDITAASKTQDFDGFSTGATMLDVNNDGWLDIYVSKAASLGNDEGRRNKLFVNQQDGTFSEEAKKWGIDDPGYTTQAYPFDYDKDGDLDLYVLNYRYDFRNNTRISGVIQSQIEEITSDQLYRNDGDRFTKVTGEAGIYNKAWGLSVAIGDFNNDGWEDIYVANDFLEPDIIYENQGDGTFRDVIKERFNHISFNSMGSDYADLDNDLYPDLVTVDMLAENYARSKENMASMSTESFHQMVRVGYHHAYMANMLQYNMSNGLFKEASQMSGIVKTDWSWAPLLADFDNDGWKDIFITNGVLKDYTNQDFRTALRAKNARGEKATLEAALAMMPSQKLNNYIYRNNGDLSYTKMIDEWGLNDPSFSNGAAYADLDNDGDLDLVVNNITGDIGLYRNNVNQNYVQVALEGPPSNKWGIGANVYVRNADQTQHQKLYVTRGYQSSVSAVLHFGLGDNTSVNEILVEWPDGKVSNVNNVSGNERITMSYSNATDDRIAMKAYRASKKEVPASNLGINYTHVENEFDDYALQLLLPQKQSTKGTGVVRSDVNGDGLDDIFVGNAAGAPAAMYIQNSDGKFVPSNQALWAGEARYEDANALFLDVEGDGDMDLYVVSAGYELGENSPLLQDRLYVNNGAGIFSKSNNALPVMLTSGKGIAAGDYDKDGDTDIFVGGNVVPGKYPLSPKSYLLENQNGKFTDATPSNNVLSEIGMVSDVLFSDYDGDDDLDLFVVGEWMQPTFYENVDGAFETTANVTGLENTAGWWFSVTASDFDNDGDTDYVLGNLGKNNKFQPKKEKPIYIYAKDFDNNGSFDVALTKINEGKLVPVRGKECSSEQNPFLQEKIGSYKEFASLEFKDIYGEDRVKDAFKLTAHMFETVYLENLGGGNFNVVKLSNEIQSGPTLSLISGDFNKDGHTDVMGVGAIYDAEVETIRYDSNYGYVLLGDGSGQFTYSKEYDLFIDSDSKDLAQIMIGGKEHFVVVSNNAPLNVFTFTP